MKKSTIAIDIDDVLAANAKGFTDFSNKRWGTNLKPDDYSEHWAKMWGIELEQLEKRREVIIKEKLFTSYSFFDDAKNVLEKLKQHYKLVVVSSRTNDIYQETIAWLDQGLEGIFSEIHFAGIWDDKSLHILKRLELTKAEVCQQIGADYLVDDQPKHCLAAANAGIKTILFGDYSWNKDVKLTSNMKRAKNWQEVLEYFNDQRQL